MNPRFLTLDEVLALHDDQIRHYGGSSSVRDIGLLQSAMGGAAATFGGAFLHDTLFEMGAAILYGICRKRPFVDGNKRTAVASALTFLEMNGVEIDADEDDFYDLVIGVADGRVRRSGVAVFLADQRGTGPQNFV